MKILLIGASGMVGSRVAAEALSRGHEVVGVTRGGRADDLPSHPRLTLAAADAGDAKALAGLAAGADAVVAALPPARDGSPATGPYLAVAGSIIDGTRQAEVKRLIWVGGAGSLEVGGGKRLFETEGFPEAYKAEALAQGEVLDVFRELTDLGWTYVSPAAEIAPGERTGEFRVGGDALLSDAEGRSRVSAEDFAVALVDTLEKGDHVRERITVAY
ncbi:NAD(P)H-binding protein [Phytomonospora sp. NPDC050363]|uniref:NAD(P)-dependent oxidoreductase n=1 Tax=Phytomonospora sp. NPDC050363 TaxID=3155642 RepID=UPI0033C3B0F0